MEKNNKKEPGFDANDVAYILRCTEVLTRHKKANPGAWWTLPIGLPAPSSASEARALEIWLATVAEVTGLLIETTLATEGAA